MDFIELSKICKDFKGAENEFVSNISVTKKKYLR